MLDTFLELEGVVAIDKLFKIIADALGVGVEMVQQNGWEFVLLYGRFVAFKTAFSYLLGFLLFGIVMGAIFYCVDMAETRNKSTIKWFWFPTLVGSAIGIIIALYNIGIYWVAPEIYSITELLTLLGVS